MQGFLKIAIPDELRDTIVWKTLPVRPNMNTRDVCKLNTLYTGFEVFSYTVNMS